MVEPKFKPRRLAVIRVPEELTIDALNGRLEIIGPPQGSVVVRCWMDHAVLSLNLLVEHTDKSLPVVAPGVEPPVFFCEVRPVIEDATGRRVLVKS